MSKFNTSTAYATFDKLAKFVEQHISNQIKPTLCFTAEQITARVTQRFVELALAPYLRVCAQNIKTNRGPISLENNEEINFSGYSLLNQSNNKKILISNKILFNAIVDFIINASHVLAIMFISTLRFNRKKMSCATLLFGVGTESITRNDSDAEFIQFCKNGAVLPLRSASTIIVQSARDINSTSPEYISYSRFPLMLLVKNNAPSFIEFASFLIEHIQATIAYLIQIYHCRMAALIGRDFAYHAMVNYLNKNKLIENIVITNSNYSAQPLWMRGFNDRNFKTHMVWYSQNTIPFTYINDPISVPLPNNRHICVDESWVWTKGFADYLHDIGIQSKSNVIGPIVWYLPNIKPESTLSDGFQITIFDVTPVISSFAEEIGLVSNYYSTENCMKFINDIISSCEKVEKETNVKIKLTLKHKREHHDLHDKKYIKLIDKLSNQSKINLADYQSDIFELIHSSQLTIVIPYSSPVSIANYLGVPSIYFDATQELLPTYESASNSYFASGKDELKSLIMQVIKQKNFERKNSLRYLDC